MYYFAYGSNMSLKRMIDRGLNPKNQEVAFLDNYKFLINKKSYKDPNIGYANVKPSNGDVVEGVLYEISNSDIKLLDKYEGFPKHYNKETLYLRRYNGYFVESVVYIANDNWTSPEQLKTTNEYKNYILEGKKWISEKYYKFLNESIKI